MKRLFLEFFIGVVTFFFLCIVSYVYYTEVYTPDYELEVEVRHVHGAMRLLDEIAEVQGQKRADEMFADYASNNLLSVTPISWDSPTLSPEIVNEIKNHGAVSFDDEYSYYVVYGNLKQIYLLAPDLSFPIWEKLDFESDLLWAFVCTSFAIYCILMMAFLARRFRALERVTLAFADGDFSVRASEKAGMRLGRLNSSFNQMADKISGLITSHKQLTNAVAHELRTPVFRVQCQLEMMEDSGLSEELHRYVAGITDDMAELEQLIEELLYFAKLERSAIPLNLSTQPVSDWLSKLVSDCQRDTDKHIELECDTRLVACLDEYQLKRAVSNIIRNAFRYAEQRIDVRVSCDEQRLTILIDDDGIGIPEQERARILEPFYRVGTARDRASGGHGLGLAIVSQIVARHQGQLEIGESDTGGARFTLILPTEPSDELLTAETTAQ